MRSSISTVEDLQRNQNLGMMAELAWMSYAAMLSGMLAACFGRLAQNSRRAEHVRAS